MTRSRISAFGLAGATLLLCGVWFLVTSKAPDGLEKVAQKLGFAARESAVARSPMPGYHAVLFGSPAAGKILAAITGAALCFLIASAIGRFLRSAKP